MTMPSQARPSLPAPREEARLHPSGPRGSLLLSATLTLGLLGCTGNPTSGDRAGQLNGHFQITPAAATLIPGQPFRFAASSTWDGEALWSVLPSTAGSIDATGTFTASLPGQYQIVAMWRSDVRYTATALVTVVLAPPEAHPSLGMVQAFGQLQGSTDGSIRNAPVVGEPVPAQMALSASGNLRLRHGFHLPPAR